MPGAGALGRQPVIVASSRCRLEERRRTLRVQCSNRKGTQSESAKTRHPGGPYGLGKVHVQSTGNSFRLSAANPALDSSGGGNLPPISRDIKAVDEGDNDDSENNSAQDIDSLLAKVVWADAAVRFAKSQVVPFRWAVTRAACCFRPEAVPASSQPICRFVDFHAWCW